MQPAAARRQIAQRLPGTRRAALTPGQVVEPDQGLIGMTGREDVGTDADQHLRELPLEAPVGAPLVDLLAELPGVHRVRQPAGERMNGRLQARPARHTGAPAFDEGPQAVRTSGPQVLTGHSFHQAVAYDGDDMRVVQLHHTRGPGAEVGAEIGHVVPEMGANGGVEAHLLEPDLSVGGGSGRDLEESLGEVPVLQRRDALRQRPEGAHQLLGRAVNDIGMRPVHHGHGDQQGSLRCLPQLGDERCGFPAAVVPRPPGRLAPLTESVPGLTGLACPAHQVGELRDLPHRPVRRQEPGDGAVRPEIFLRRHTVQAQMPPENADTGRPFEHHAAELQVRV